MRLIGGEAGGLLLLSHYFLSTHDHDALVAVADRHTREIVGLLNLSAVLISLDLMDARRRHALFVEPDRGAVEAGGSNAGGRTVLIPINVLLDRHATVVPVVEFQRDKRLAILRKLPCAIVIGIARARYRAVGTERHRHRFLLVGLAERGICLVTVSTGLLIRMLEQMIGAGDLLSREESLALDLFLCSLFSGESERSGDEPAVFVDKERMHAHLGSQSHRRI